MKKNIKKSAPKTKPTQSVVLRVVSPIAQTETAVENLPVWPRDNRLPAVGAVITKTYRGKSIKVKVLETGFEYQGKLYKSISRAAMDIVNRPISGYVFFGLSK